MIINDIEVPANDPFYSLLYLFLESTKQNLNASKEDAMIDPVVGE
jgi:hypothetical protein